jgi:hypothetical protein
MSTRHEGKKKVNVLKVEHFVNFNNMRYNVKSLVIQYSNAVLSIRIPYHINYLKGI